MRKTKATAVWMMGDVSLPLVWLFPPNILTQVPRRVVVTLISWTLERWENSE